MCGLWRECWYHHRNCTTKRRLLSSPLPRRAYTIAPRARCLADDTPTGRRLPRRVHVPAQPAAQPGRCVPDAARFRDRTRPEDLRHHRRSKGSAEGCIHTVEVGGEGGIAVGCNGHERHSRGALGQRDTARIGAPHAHGPFQCSGSRHAPHEQTSHPHRLRPIQASSTRSSSSTGFLERHATQSHLHRGSGLRARMPASTRESSRYLRRFGTPAAGGTSSAARPSATAVGYVAHRVQSEAFAAPAPMPPMRPGRSRRFGQSRRSSSRASRGHLEIRVL